MLTQRRKDLKDVPFSEMSFIYDEYFWVDYEKISCGKGSQEGNFSVAVFICQAWERRKDILFKIKL